MSLFVDVIDSLSNQVKKHLYDVIESERKKQDRRVRKICDICSKYLDFGELYYTKMEEAISELNETGISGNPFYALLYAVLHDPLDENDTVIKYLWKFQDSPLGAPYHQELSDFITIARYVTLNEQSMLEPAGTILIERYVTEQNVAEVLSNLYLKDEKEENLPVFLKLLAKAKELFPDSNSVESLNAFLNIKSNNYEHALSSFMIIKNRLEQNSDHPYYAYNMASIWDNIAGCHLKTGDAEKALESCETAISFDDQSDSYKVGAPILHKKAEAFILKGENDKALPIVDNLLKEDSEDEVALRIKEKLMKT